MSDQETTEDARIAWEIAIHHCNLKMPPLKQVYYLHVGYRTTTHTVEYADPYKIRLASMLENTLQSIGHIHENAVAYAINNIEEQHKLDFVVEWLLTHGASVDHSSTYIVEAEF